MFRCLFFIILYANVECIQFKRDDVYATTPLSLYNSKTFGNDIASFPSNKYYAPSYPTSGYLSTSYRPDYTSANYGEFDQTYNAYENIFVKNMNMHCLNRSPQSGISVDSVTGMWYGVEIIQHLAADTRVDYARTCLVIHISEPKMNPATDNHQWYHVQHINAKFRQEYRHLRLIWDEAGEDIEYSLYFRNDSVGYWQVMESQNGSLPKRDNYQQFTGSVQVLKAVHDHLVLSFCQEEVRREDKVIPAQFYTVLFSREPGFIPTWEVDAVHNLLQNKKLSIASRRMVCGNSGIKTLYSIFSIVVCLLTYVSLA